MVDSSNAEALIGDALMRAAGRMLDEVLFDANPESAARPAGLRNGVAALTASTNTDPIQAVFEDAAALINSLAPVAGNGPLCAGRFARARFVDALALCIIRTACQSLWLECRDQRSARDRARRAGGGIEPRAGDRNLQGGDADMDTAPQPAGTRAQLARFFKPTASR